MRGVDNPDDKELAEHLDAEDTLDAAWVLRDALSNLCKAMAHLDAAEGLRCLPYALFSLFGATTVVLLPEVEKDTLSAEDRLRDAFEDLRDAISLSATLKMGALRLRMGGRLGGMGALL